MTMTLTVKHTCGDSYQARIKIAGHKDIVLKPGEEDEIHLCSNQSAHVFEETLGEGE